VSAALAGAEEKNAMSTARVVLTAEERDVVASCLKQIRQRQLESGSIRMTAQGDEVWLEQYFALEAVLALLAAPENDSGANVAAAGRYLNWYAANIEEPQGVAFNCEGTLSDIRKIATKPKNYDSIDSYAGLYLLASSRYARHRKPETAIVAASKRSLQAIRDVIENKASLLKRSGGAGLTGNADSNGLPIARDDYPMHYLMDACECHAGLRSAGDYFHSLGMDHEATEARRLADGIARAATRFLGGDRFAFVIDNGNHSQLGAGAYPMGLANLFGLAYVPHEFPRLWTTLRKEFPLKPDEESSMRPERWLIAARTAAPGDVAEIKAMLLMEARKFSPATYLNRLSITALALEDGESRYPVLAVPAQ